MMIARHSYLDLGLGAPVLKTMHAQQTSEAYGSSNLLLETSLGKCTCASSVSIDYVRFIAVLFQYV
jgi:hypothetical protein